MDAFALSLIKAEKQARRLVTYFIYQHTITNLSDETGPGDERSQTLPSV
ncbi:MAG: hypothetical protein HY047_08655 [Acidobacteria bacterium]|nr:hypothetical protein [Acidobacteriota bacterium]